MVDPTLNYSTKVSINKKYTGQSDPEFNLRHDWNSILTSLTHANGTDFKVTDFTEDYFPHRDVLHKYLGDFAKHYNLKIATSTNVVSIKKDSGDKMDFSIELEPNPGFTLTCKTVVWAAGLGKAREFENELYTPYHRMSVDGDLYKNKTVAIVGAGQTAFECAKAIYGKTATTMMLYRNPPSLSWNTHYVGHLRAINNEILDAYQHKSLDALVQLNDHGENKWIESLAKREDGKLYYPGLENRLGTSFDVVISAVGWTFDSSAFAIKPRMMRVGDSADRYPRLDPSFQSTNIPGLYFAGTLAHGIDKGTSSGGFIHGFRYNVRALARILLTEKGCDNKDGVGCLPAWPVQNVGCFKDGLRKDLAASKFAKNILERIKVSSGLYQMFDELQDVYVFNPEDKCMKRYEEVPKRYVKKLLKSIYGDIEVSVFTMTFKYREGFSKRARDVFDEERVVIPQLPPKMLQGELAYKELPNGWDKLNFLHPVLEPLQYSTDACTSLLNEPFHMLEDLVTMWSRPLDLIPVVEFLMVRVFSNPCDFADNEDEVKRMQTYWRLFLSMASGGGAKQSTEEKKNSSFNVPTNMNGGQKPIKTSTA